MRWRAAFFVVIAIGLAVTADAQFRRGLFGVRLARPADFDGRFHFCRLVYQGTSQRGGGSWTTDYPNADINMSIRLSELTNTRVSFTVTGSPITLLVRPTDDDAVPVSVRDDDGAGQRRVQRRGCGAAARRISLKGGFLWADDFWGTYQWEQWEKQLRKVLPAAAIRSSISR